jgi:hypothetical protein
MAAKRSTRAAGTTRLTLGMTLSWVLKTYCGGSGVDGGQGLTKELCDGVCGLRGSLERGEVRACFAWLFDKLSCRCTSLQILTNVQADVPPATGFSGAPGG